jgi:hypothetical protein
VVEMANHFFGPCSPEWFNSLFFGNRATALSEQENTNLRSVFMNEFESDPAADEGNRLMVRTSNMPHTFGADVL